jgi:hypothetical protein
MQAERFKASQKKIDDLKAVLDEYAIADPQGRIICVISKYMCKELPL